MNEPENQKIINQNIKRSTVLYVNIENNIEFMIEYKYEYIHVL